MGGFALLLRYVPWWQAAILAGGALAFNRFVLPRMGGTRLYRDAEQTRGYSTGMLLYPLSVLVLIFLFPTRLDIVAAAWGILAAGDGMATIVGHAPRRSADPVEPRQDRRRHRWPLWLCGGVAGACLAWWCRPAVAVMPDPWFSLGAPLVAAAVAALAETLPDQAGRQRHRADDGAAACCGRRRSMNGEAIAAASHRQPAGASAGRGGERARRLRRTPRPHGVDLRSDRRRRHRHPHLRRPPDGRGGRC